jgi:hypothetical protein
MTLEIFSLVLGAHLRCLFKDNSNKIKDKAKRYYNTHMIKGFIDLPELQHQIEELQGIVRVKPRIASLEDTQKLLEEGYDMKWISRKSGIPESAIAKYEEEKRVFLSTGQLPSTHRVHTTFSGSSWTNYW